LKTPETGGFFTYSSPMEEFLTINYSASKAFNLSVELFDLNGVKRINTSVYLNVGYNQIQIPSAQLASGIYILRLYTENGVVSRKTYKK
jgi:hypothetical protein